MAKLKKKAAEAKKAQEAMGDSPDEFEDDFEDSSDDSDSPRVRRVRVDRRCASGSVRKVSEFTHGYTEMSGNVIKFIKAADNHFQGLDSKNMDFRAFYSTRGQQFPSSASKLPKTMG